MQQPLSIAQTVHHFTNLVLQRYGAPTSEVAETNSISINCAPGSCNGGLGQVTEWGDWLATAGCKSSTPQVPALSSLFLFPHQPCNAIDVLTAASTGKLTTSPPPPQQVFCKVIVHPVPAGEGKVFVCEVWQ